MPKKSKLLAALDAHKGKDYKLEKQKKLQKQAGKRKKLKHISEEPPIGDTDTTIDVNGIIPQLDEGSEGYETDESGDAPVAVSLMFITQRCANLTPFFCR